MPHQRLIQNSIVVTVLVILVLCVFYGFKAGRDIARTRITITNVASIQQGLSFFYSDQSRYPSLVEFENQEIMGIYFRNFPPQSFMFEECAPHYAYNTFRQLSYELDFCVPRESELLSKGKTRITDKDALLAQ